MIQHSGKVFLTREDIWDGIRLITRMANYHISKMAAKYRHLGENCLDIILKQVISSKIVRAIDHCRPTVECISTATIVQPSMVLHGDRPSMLYHDQHSGESSMVFLLMINLDSSDPSCIYTTQFVSFQAKQYDATLILTFDQPLYWKALSCLVLADTSHAVTVRYDETAVVRGVRSRDCS